MPPTLASRGHKMSEDLRGLPSVQRPNRQKVYEPEKINLDKEPVKIAYEILLPRRGNAIANFAAHSRPLCEAESVRHRSAARTA